MSEKSCSTFMTFWTLSL